MGEELIKKLVVSFYFGKLDAQDILFLLNNDKELMQEVITNLYRSGYDEIIDKLMLEHTRSFLEYCYELD